MNKKLFWGVGVGSQMKANLQFMLIYLVDLSNSPEKDLLTLISFFYWLKKEKNLQILMLSTSARYCR